jgi:hypothetical protein
MLSMHDALVGKDASVSTESVISRAELELRREKKLAMENARAELRAKVTQIS